MIIAIDFDGTCVEYKYPIIGNDLPECVEWLKKWTKSGIQLILYTMRDKKELKDAIHWFLERHIPLIGINKNPHQDKWTSSPKVYADLYVDDAALGCPLAFPINNRPYVDWSIVGPLVMEKLNFVGFGK